MKIHCPHCLKEFDWSLSDEEKKLALKMLTDNKEFMRELGKKAAEEYIKSGDLQIK